MWVLLAYVAGAGAVGGVANSLITDKGFRPPGWLPGDAKIYQFGWIGNVLCGAIAAVVSWGLYGPVASNYVAVAGGIKAAAAVESVGLTLSTLVGALLVGIAGARWLSSTVDEKVLRSAGEATANKPPSPELAKAFAEDRPVDVLRMAQLP